MRFLKLFTLLQTEICDLAYFFFKSDPNFPYPVTDYSLKTYSNSADHNGQNLQPISDQNGRSFAPHIPL